MAHQIPVKVLSVESAEYLHPANHTIQLRFTDQSWLVIDKWKDWDIFKPIVDFAEVPENNFRIIEFGEKARLEEESLKALIRAQAEKVFEEKKVAAELHKANLEEVKAVEPTPVPLPPAPPVTLPPVVETPPAPPVESPPVLVAEPLPAPVVENGTVTLNKEDPTVPTVTVTVPEVVTPIVQAEVVNVVPAVNTASIDAQVEIKLTPVEAVQPDAVVTQAETPPPDAANIAVAISPEDEAKLKAANLEVTAIVEEVVKVAGPELPPKAEEIREVPVVEAPVEQAVPAALDVKTEG